MASRLIPRAVRGTATPTSRPPPPPLRRRTTCTTSPNSWATTTPKPKRTPKRSRARHGIDHASYPASRRRCRAVSRPKKSCFSTCYLRSGCRWPCWPTLGAIVFHIAERYAGLLPDDASARARAITWMFAALSTVEPPIHDRGIAMLLEHDKTWYEERLPILEDRVRVRLGELSSRLGAADWLDDAFSAGDLLMVTVLRRLNGSGLLEKYPNLSAYVARGESRAAF